MSLRQADRTHARTRRCAAMTLLAVSIAAVPHARQDQPAPAPAKPTYQLALGFADQTISDEDLARLARAVAVLVPSEHWGFKTVPQAPEPWSVVTLVDQVYDYFPEGEYSRPQTASALAEIIRTHNTHLLQFDTGFKAGARVKVPPFPVRAKKGTTDYYRVFTARHHASRIFSDPSKLVLDGPAMEVELAATSELQQGAKVSRQATFSIIVLPVDAKLNFLSTSRDLLPPSVITMTVLPPSTGSAAGNLRAIGATAVELLGEGNDCATAAEQYWTASRYRAQLESLVAGLTDGEKGILLKKAATERLALVDVDFSGVALGHGRKVRDVVRSVLERAGLGQLDGRVVEQDLCPSTTEGRAAVRTSVERFVSIAHPVDDLIKQQALSWVDASPIGCQNRHFAIPDLVVQAILWDQLRGGGVVNLSFRADGAIRTKLDGALQDSDVIAVVAAGNENRALQAGWTLHDSASFKDRVVTVTHGDETAVLGTFSNPQDQTKVWLAAPGCGFGVTDESGSSLAAPFVATAIWIRRLMSAVRPATHQDLTAPERSVLTASSRLAPRTPIPVQSGSLFDFARFVATPVKHVQFLDDSVAPLTAFDLVYKCDGESKAREIHSEHGSDAWLTIAAYTRDASQPELLLWRREIDRVPGATTVRFPHGSRECRVIELEFDATLGDGPPLHLNLQQFVERVRSFTF